MGLRFISLLKSVKTIHDIYTNQVKHFEIGFKFNLVRFMTLYQPIHSTLFITLICLEALSEQLMTLPVSLELS